jgi:hypothetical protein
LETDGRAKRASGLKAKAKMGNHRNFAFAYIEARNFNSKMYVFFPSLSFLLAISLQLLLSQSFVSPIIDLKENLERFSDEKFFGKNLTL